MALERNGDGAAFYSAPRIAFLGDLLLREPTVRKRVYMDAARQIIADDDRSWLYAMAYFLNTPYEELPGLDDRRKLVGAIGKFAADRLSDFTYRQILCAVDYALNGYSEDALEGEYGDVKERRDAVELPQACVSMARMILNKALGYGLDHDGCARLTLPQLDRVVAIAAMNRGVDVMKDENMELTGRFYTVAGRIYARLKKTKEEDNGKEQHRA